MRCLHFISLEGAARFTETGDQFGACFCQGCGSGRKYALPRAKQRTKVHTPKRYIVLNRVQQAFSFVSPKSRSGNLAEIDCEIARWALRNVNSTERRDYMPVLNSRQLFWPFFSWCTNRSTARLGSQMLSPSLLKASRIELSRLNIH